MSIYSCFVLIMIQRLHLTWVPLPSFFLNAILCPTDPHSEFICVFWHYLTHSFIHLPPLLITVSLRLEWIHIYLSKQRFCREDAVDFIFSLHRESHNVCPTFSEATVGQGSQMVTTWSLLSKTPWLPFILWYHPSMTTLKSTVLI